MLKTSKILFPSAVIAVIISIALCADFFESLLVRLECYGTMQPGCKVEFTDAYPEVAWSHTNLTKATTHFYMFTNENTEHPELMHKCGGGLPPNTTFNPNCPTEIFVPGFVSGICNYAIFRELKNERLKSGCYNVILVDYMWGNNLDLVEAKENLYIVAKQLAIVIRKLKADYGVTEDDFILTGHSYGAHVAGFVGKQEKIGTIIGLDPSGGPFSKDTPPEGRLDAGDAKCVQVWHCNAGDCLPYFFGLNLTCGTIDFWINGGSYQPSCLQQTMKSFMKKDYVYASFSLAPPACFHFQCLQYYRASMNPQKCSFIGSKCSSYSNFQRGCCRNCGSNGQNCAVLGINACDCLKDNQKFKSYYVDTDLDCPYCNNAGIRTRTYSCAAANISRGVTNPI